MEKLTNFITLASCTFIYLFFIIIIGIDIVFLYHMLRDKKWTISIICIVILLICLFILFAQLMEITPKHG